MGSEWKRSKLRDVGIQLIDCVHKTPPALSNGYPYIGIPQMKEGYIDFAANPRLISKEHLEEWSVKAKPTKDDIVLSRRCNPGATAYVPGGVEFALGQNLVLLRSSGEDVFPPFLRWLVRGPEWWAEIDKYLNVGSVFDSLRCADIPNFEFLFPPLPEQKAIAHILGSLDDKIELNRRMNATLEGLAQALFQSWFVDFDPVLDNALAAGNPIPDELTDRAAVRRQALDNGTANRAAAQHFPASFQLTEELGWIPEGWEILDLDNTVSTIIDHRGKTPKKLKSDWVETGYPAISAKNIKDGELVRKDTIRFTDQELYERWMPEELQKGDLLMTSEAPLGEKLYLAKKFKWVLSQRLFGLRANEKISGIYLYHWLNTENAKAEIEGRASGTTVQGIRQSELRKVKVLTPSKSSVSVFSEASDSLMDKQALNESKTDILEKLRDSLLPQLISGELRIPDAAKLAEEALA